MYIIKLVTYIYIHAKHMGFRFGKLHGRISCYMMLTGNGTCGLATERLKSQPLGHTKPIVLLTIVHHVL